MSEGLLIAIISVVAGLIYLLLANKINRANSKIDKHELKHEELEVKIGNIPDKAFLEELKTATEVHENELSMLRVLKLPDMNTNLIEIGVYVKKHEKDIYGMNDKIDVKFDKLECKFDKLSARFDLMYAHVNKNTNSVNDLVQTLKDMNKI